MTLAAEWIRIRGARTHNLHNVDVDLPRGQLTVFAGPSGSGKSSLAFDTLHAEGQRRYLETLRGEARALVDQLERPDVDAVEGLPPTLCVSQQTTRPRPRSTLATVTEIHDHLRLLWSRLGTPHCPNCDIPIARHTVEEIVRDTLSQPEGTKIYILAPLVRERPGNHAEVFQRIQREGFLRARVDGVMHEIRATPKLPAKKVHTIEVVIDRLVVRSGMDDRLRESLATALKHGRGQVMIAQAEEGDWQDRFFSTLFACPRCDLAISELEPRDFHFNNPRGACPTCGGLGQVWDIDEKLLAGAETLASTVRRLLQELPEEVHFAGPDKRTLERLAAPLDANLQDWPDPARQALLFGIPDSGWQGWIGPLREVLRQEEDSEARDAVQSLATYVACPDCSGARLNRNARAVRFEGETLPTICSWTVERAATYFSAIAPNIACGFATEKRTAINDAVAKPHQASVHAADRIRHLILPEITKRLHFLRQVGLGYLTLDRPAVTLSGGELQRARIATHLGGGLLGVCYILDEPTMGLHPRDTSRLIEALKTLQRRGNTVIVVEHDEEVIRQADFLVDIGPGAGRDGGRLLAAGATAEVLKNPASVTGAFLREERKEASFLASASASQIVVHGARHHNLQNVDVAIPLGRLVCLTGVSGSGKSSLGRDILCYAARRHLGLLAPTPGQHDRIEGLDHIDKVLEVDQKPLGRSSRSNPISYVGGFDEIRKLFAATKLAKVRGYKANRFSFNAKGGRCEECLGQGSRRMSLQFLPDMEVPCPVCRGQRFNRPTLEVKFRDLSIAQVLGLSSQEALALFENVPQVRRPIQALVDVGLGYVALGQASSTLSGGEAQRVKLAAELAQAATGRTLYLLDEPTSGLHFIDVARLIGVLRKLTKTGNTVVVIEHHLDLIAAADWVIDLGPEAGAAGGRVVAAGPPALIEACAESATGQYLRNRLATCP